MPTNPPGYQKAYMDTRRAKARKGLDRWLKYPHKCKQCGRVLFVMEKPIEGGPPQKYCVPASDADRAANPCNWFTRTEMVYRPRARRKAVAS